MTNIAYLLGYDNVSFDYKSKSFRTNTAAPAQGAQNNRAIVNRIMPTIQNRLSRLVKNPPKFEVRPESMDQDDKDAATLSTEICTWLYDKQRIDQKRIPLVMWLQQCGYAFLHVCWDDMLGNIMSTGPDGSVDFEGDARYDVVSAFEVYEDPAAKNDDDWADCIRVKPRKLSYFRENYERGDLVKQEDVWLLGTQYEAKINAMTKSGLDLSSTQLQMQDSAIEISYYERRSKKYPNGRHIIIANGVLLKDDELIIGEIPLSKFDDTVIGGKFASESLITFLRNPQDRVNIMLRKRAQWVDMTLAGKYMAFKGHGIMKESFDNQSGEFIEVDLIPNAPNGGMPVAVQVPQMPSYIYEEEKSMMEHFDATSGIGEISQGNLPAAGIPAIGMQFLQEQDMTRIGVVTGQHEMAFAKAFSHGLKLVEKMYKIPRKLKITGDSGAYLVKSIEGADIKGNTDVLVVKGSMLPTSLILRRQEILNTLDRGLMGNPQDPKVASKALADLQYGDTTDIWKKHSLDMMQIKAEIETITAGNMPEIHELDNHPLAIEQLNEFRIGDRYKTLSPKSQLLVDQAINVHIQMGLQLANPGLQAHADMAQSMVQAAQSQDQKPIDQAVNEETLNQAVQAGGPQGAPQLPTQGPPQ